VNLESRKSKIGIINSAYCVGELMRMFVGVTDSSWFSYLSQINPDEINFWQPGGRQTFKAVESNGLFLFKLHSPQNYIAGGGFFVRHSFLPVSLAWETFGDKNGTADYQGFSLAIHKYRKTDRMSEPDPVIGCIILASPFFFDRSEWILVPEDWKPNIVQGKSYDSNDIIGGRLYKQVQERLQRMEHTEILTDRVRENSENNRYGPGQTNYPRIGQGGFRVLVTEAYQRRCAITGEKTLPVLDAAHIKPYTQDGPHRTSNGLLLRQDIHTLFDRGYLTVGEDLRIEVSKRIKEDYGNGREYYALHGRELVILPSNIQERPAPEFLRWHNENVFMA
jgi:putative restriction endonuclease